METNGWRGPHLMKSSIKYPIFQSSLQPWMHTVEWDFWWRLKWSADGIISLLRCPFRLPFPCVWIPHLYPFTYPKHGFIQACAGQHFSFSPKIRQWKMCLQVLYNIVRIKSTQINSTMIIKWLKKNGDLVDHFAGAFLWFDDDFSWIHHGILMSFRRWTGISWISHHQPLAKSMVSLALINSMENETSNDNDVPKMLAILYQRICSP